MGGAGGSANLMQQRLEGAFRHLSLKERCNHGIHFNRIAIPVGHQNGQDVTLLFAGSRAQDQALWAARAADLPIGSRKRQLPFAGELDRC